MRVPPVTETNLQIVIQAVRDLSSGASNAVGNAPVQLAPGMATTTVSDPLCTSSSMISLSPLTQNAAAAQVWVAAVGNGLFTLGHDVSAATDRNFNYEIRRP